MREKYFSSFLFLLLILPLSSIAQNYGEYTWYLGNRIIEFNRSNDTPTASPNTIALNGPAAVVANPATGDVLFYTDGQNVYDATNRVMPNGTGLNGDPTNNQAVVVAKVPGEDNKYYIITNSATGQISMTMVDMLLNGNTSTVPLGDVDESVIAKNTIVAAPLVNQSQAMLVIPAPNGFWLITHTEGTTTYNVTLVTDLGPQTVSSFSLGSITNASNFAYNPSTGQIAVSPGVANQNIEILSFADGQLALDAVIPNSYVGTAPTDGVYDVEWSPNGQYLYVSGDRQDGQPDLRQYDITNLDPSTGLITPVSILPPTLNITASYGLQVGPDGAIYHLYESNGQIFMGKITEPDNVAAEVEYVPVAVTGNFSVKQFPSFLADEPVDVTINFTGTGCANQPTQLFPTVTPAADSLEWFITGETDPFSKAWSPVHTFETAGPVSITVVAYLGGEETSFEKTITIGQLDTQITIEPEVTGCHSEFTEPRVKPPGWVPCGTGGDACLTVTAQIEGTQGTIRWFGPDGEIAGNNSTTLTPPSPGYYYMVVGNGPCFAYAGVNVKEYEVPDPRANVWYFGNGAGIDFNPLFQDPPGNMEDISNGVMSAPEGTATISDRNGNVILYTDGESVWVRDNPVPIATDLGGSNTSTQSSIIMAVPGNETQFYIFTTTEIEDGTYELRYTLFDLTLNGGTGGIVDPDNDPATLPPNEVLFTKSTERLIVVGNWLIAHEYGNNTFRAYEITDAGIGTPVISNVGSDHSTTSFTTGEGYMMYGAGRIAVALPGPWGNRVEVFDFDSGSGAITNARIIDINNDTNQQVYGVNFSPSGAKMYVTLLNNPGEILEYWYDETLDTYVAKDPIVMTGLEGVQPGALQYGPDGTLYVAVEGENALGAIDYLEGENEKSTFRADATPPLVGTVTLGLPNFVQQIANPISEPGVAIENACINQETQFNATGKDPTIDVFNWEFSEGDPLPDGGPSVTRTFTTAGQHWVRLTITNKCETDYFVEQIFFDVHDIPLPPPMLNGADGILCDNAGITLVGSVASDPTAPMTYDWSDGSTNPTLQVTRPGEYSVTITNQFGCTNQGTETIFPSLNEVDLGPDLDICQGSSRQLNAGNTGATYAWFENNNPAPVGTQQSLNVNPTVPGQYTYRVDVSVQLTNRTCTFSDEIVLNVNATPQFTPTATDDLTCGPPDNGQIALNITQPAGRPVAYEIRGNGGFFQSGNNITAPANPIIGNLAADFYNVTVADQLSGCAATAPVPVNNQEFTFDAAQSGSCFPDIAIEVSNIVSLGPAPTTYTISNASGALLSGGVTLPSFTTSNVPAPPNNQVSATYTITLSNGACVTSRNVVLQNSNPSYGVQLSLTDLCSLSQIAAVTTPAGATTFNWTATDQSGAGNGIVNQSGNAVTLAVGTWVVNVSAAGDGTVACPGTASGIVTVSPPILADFEQSDACVNPVLLTATPTGATFNYQWSRNGSVVSGGTPRVVTTADDGATFQVRVTDFTNQCSDVSEPRVVRVIQPFTVDILPPPFACENTDFILTADPSRPDVTQFQWFLNGTALAQTGVELTDNRGGTYSVVGTISGCSSPPAEETISPSPKPTVELGALKRLCPYPGPVLTRTAKLDPGTGYASYEWFRVTNSGLEPLNVNTQNFEASEPGVYLVEITDASGCPNTDEVEVIEDCDPIITGPNAFRPGSTIQDNEGFKLITQFISDEDFQILIFNRWGEMVYESNERFFKWNGGYKGNAGQILPAGTYAYVVRYRSEYHPEEGVKEKRGGVVLVR